MVWYARYKRNNSKYVDGLHDDYDGDFDDAGDYNHSARPVVVMMMVMMVVVCKIECKVQSEYFQVDGWIA